MRTRWIPWALSALLLASVLVGLIVERPPGAGADPVKGSDRRTELPKFDCQDRSSAPYEITKEARDGHVAWLVDRLELSDDQAMRMSAVFGNASITADDFWRQTREHYCDLRDDFYDDLRSVLNEKQLSVLESIRQEKRKGARRGPQPSGDSEAVATNDEFGKQP